MPIYRKSKGKWRVVLKMHGQRQDWVVEGSHDDAEEFEARKRLEAKARGPTDHRTAPGFSDFCASSYRPHAKATLAHRTWTNRLYQLATLMDHFGNLRMDRIGRAEVDGFVAARKAAKIGATTINDDLKVLKRIVAYAIETGAPVRPLKVPLLKTSAKARRVRSWTADEVARLFASIEALAPRILPLVVFVANTGCRKTEAIRVRWSGVDFKAGVVHIEFVPEDAKENVDEWQPKTGELRAVPMNATVRAWLERLKAENEKAKRPSAFVFVSKTGRPWRVWPQKKFDEARKSAVPAAISTAHAKGAKGHDPKAPVAACDECQRHALKGGPHTLRHTFATHFLAARPDLFLLSKILGHSHGRTTLLYSHLLPGTVAAAAGAVSFAPGVGPAEAEAARAWSKKKVAPKVAR